MDVRLAARSQAISIAADSGLRGGNAVDGAVATVGPVWHGGGRRARGADARG